MEAPKRLAVKLNSKAERSVKQGHPWIFSDSILKIKEGGKTGDLAILFDSKTDKAFAIGLFDADSPIRIKVIHHDGPAKIDEAFFKNKLEHAFELRKPLLRTNTNAYRLLFGENDGFPGLIVDVYNKVGVLKLYSAIWFPYLEMIIPHIVAIAKLDCLILRLSRSLEKSDAPYEEGTILYGALENPEVEFVEYGVRFKTDVLLGHKTGFFLDHRENRRRIGKLSKGKTVLDVFSYAGGFSIHALAGGAKEVTSLDLSKQALELAKQNAELNKPTGKHFTIAGDAFEELKTLIRQEKKYDVVIIDPPSFAKSQAENEIAKKKYVELTEIGIQLTEKGGLLLLASCSSRVTEEELREIHKSVFWRLGVNYTLEDFTQHDIDHPIGFAEGAYLKSGYYRINK
ncbi:MAG TPA: class I SAM-dependent rRNA methyltransferase [Brumimicrobium sp.]|nr:class I SAM-dependent rRNA methyltransferase [Brumimicrobium sp.]